jgi:hypothetical protein
MKLIITRELFEIFREIENRNLSLVQWREIESDDEWRSQNYIGGFDATEDEFCFSYFDKAKVEYWFQKSLDEVREINKGLVRSFEMRLAE